MGMIKSYDPDNPDNNYHLTNQFCKQMQLNKYRPICSEIIEGALYLASYAVASDLDTLQKHGITHIVNAAGDVCESCFPEQFTYLTYYLKDTNQEAIQLYFYKTIEFIDQAISTKGRVLVHCREGVSRS